MEPVLSKQKVLGKIHKFEPEQEGFKPNSHAAPFLMTREDFHLPPGQLSFLIPASQNQRYLVDKETKRLYTMMNGHGPLYAMTRVQSVRAKNNALIEGNLMANIQHEYAKRGIAPDKVMQGLVLQQAALSNAYKIQRRMNEQPVINY